MMKRILTRFAYWVFRHYYGYEAVVMQTPNKIIDIVGLARNLCARQDEISAEGTSGEYKRHQVYSELIKKYPTTDRKALAMAIEVALCGWDVS